MTHLKKTLLLAGGLCLAAVPVGAAQAQSQSQSQTQAQTQEPAQTQVGEARSDLPREVTGSFYITLEEIRDNSREVFKSFAGPGGPPVSKEQFLSYDLPDRVGPPGQDSQLLERLFGLLDTDGNGQVSLSEWNSQINKDLSFADANDDGRITLTELSNARENMGIGDAIGMLF